MATNQETNTDLNEPRAKILFERLQTTEIIRSVLYHGQPLPTVTESYQFLVDDTKVGNNSEAEQRTYTSYSDQVSGSRFGKATSRRNTTTATTSAYLASSQVLLVPLSVPTLCLILSIVSARPVSSPHRDHLTGGPMLRGPGVQQPLRTLNCSPKNSLSHYQSTGNTANSLSSMQSPLPQVQAVLAGTPVPR